jgi:putative phosphoesterase
MGSIALLYDVHGNLPALEAVLADASAAGATQFILGGDYALFGAYPAESVARLRKLGSDVTWIRGNVDRWCAHPGQAPEGEPFVGAIAACREALEEQVVAELGALQEHHLAPDGTMYCHASPISDMRSFASEASEEDAELLGPVGDPGRVVFGHTHIQFERHAGRVHLVNPGSVGMPLDGDHRAAYALLSEEGGVEFRRVGYDHEALAEVLLERFEGAPWAEEIAGRVRRASLVS